MPNSTLNNMPPKRIALFGKPLKSAELPVLTAVIDGLLQKGILLNLHTILGKHHPSLPHWHSAAELADWQPDLLLTLGGDGTLLEVIQYVYGTQLPVLGINLGRLGFLASIARADLPTALPLIAAGDWKTEQRVTLRLHAPDFSPGLPVALNDFTLHKRATGSMIQIRLEIDGERAIEYWADGLIVSTPTGSTAYSLSCGGPIVFPDSDVLVITPVAPHNLSVRPLIVPANARLNFFVSGRGKNLTLSLDSRYQVMEYGAEVRLATDKWKLSLARLHAEKFSDTLSEKLLWGKDNRNAP